MNFQMADLDQRLERLEAVIGQNPEKLVSSTKQNEKYVFFEEIGLTFFTITMTVFSGKGADAKCNFPRVKYGPADVEETSHAAWFLRRPHCSTAWSP